MSVNEKMTAIANAIRGKTGKTDPLTLDQMAAEIAGIETVPILEPLTVTENGAYTPAEGVDGFSKVTVEVESAGGGIQVGQFYKIVPPTREELEAQGYAVHEFTLTSTPTAVWTLPNPLGVMPSAEVVLFRVDDGISEIFGTGFPVYAINTEFVNGTYTNQNAFYIGTASAAGQYTGGAVTFVAGAYRWLGALPTAEIITLRSPMDHEHVRWQPGEYILAVK